VFVQVLDPEAFGGLSAFKRQMDFLVEAARNTPVRAGAESVRLPGERGFERYREQNANGVAPYPKIIPALEPWAQKLDVTPPLAL
jgi:L-lactate dehydrogenase